ncbi:MAG TPA: plastocyanin/azurin family copper-binding protein [Micrococcaceae bacterium]|nr:plastocyanin/azurin family copper-binding protein [Micrococcaceae bacterium]
MRHAPGIHPKFHKQFHKLPFIVATLVALATPVALAGPAGASSWSPRTWTVQVGSESGDQEIQGMAFLPSEIDINAGDTIKWEANSAEIHTVTFLSEGQSLESTQPFDPGVANELLPRGTNWYDGHSYYNSGLLANVTVPGFPSAKSYSLKFPDQGDFTYYCLVHGMAMKGMVHVRAAGSDYPHSQSDYNEAAESKAHSILEDGYKLDDALLEQSSNHKVLVGGDDGTAMIMRFVRQTVTVHVGDKVWFVNNGMGEPHTVTFGTEPANLFAPWGDPTTFSGGQLNSGIMPPGSSFPVTFTKAGTFDYICGLHDYMGMVGKVIVED